MEGEPLSFLEFPFVLRKFQIKILSYRRKGLKKSWFSYKIITDMQLMIIPAFFSNLKWQVASMTPFRIILFYH